jgi:DNA-binding protein YbaB
MNYSIQGLFPFVRKMAGGAMLLGMVLSMTGSATAEIRIAVRSISAANTQTAPLDARALENALRSAIIEAVEKARNNSRCEAKAIEISPEFIKDREVEKMLQKKGYASKDGLKIGKIVVSDVIDGVVGHNDDGGLDYLIQATNLVNNKVVARISGDTSKSRILDAAQSIADGIMEQACRKKSYRLQAQYNDLKIDDTVCDLTKPFGFNGLGPTAGIRFSLTPTGERGGTFSLSGPAAGVSWSGGGNYTQTVTESGGTLNMNGTWRITTPQGAFSDSGTISGKLTAFSSTACATTAD